MTIMERITIAAACGAVVFFITRALAPEPITDELKAAAWEAIIDRWAIARREYRLSATAPIVVWDEPEFYDAPRRALAATVCSMPPLIVFDPEDAARDPRGLFAVTIPHEIAHAILCELEPEAEPHGEAWLELATRFGMESPQ